MSRYDRCRRLVALAACLGSTTAVAALASAGPAMAVPCKEGPLYGSGSSFQNTAQKVFKEHWPAVSKCTVKPTESTITYTATSSGKGLEVFGAGNLKNEFAEELRNRKDTTVKALENESKPCGPEIVKAAAKSEPSGKCLDLYVGTDDAPSLTQLANMTKGAVGKTGHLPAEGGIKENRGAVVIPVAQGPVALMLSLPADCKVTSAAKIDVSNVAIGQIYEAETAKGSKGAEDPGGIQAQGGYLTATWGALLTQLGTTFKEEAVSEETLTRFKAGAEETTHSKEQIEKNEAGTKVVTNSEKVKVKGEQCSALIKPQVRGAESGTSYAFKSYNNQINPTVWAGLNTDGITWPVAVSNKPGGEFDENQTTSFEKFILQEKGGQLAEATSAIPGSIGYADSADAAKGGGMTAEAASSQKAVPNGATIEEVVQEGEAENKTTKKMEPILVKKTSPVKSITHQILYAQVQNSGTGKPTKESEFATPLLAGNKANCSTTELIAGDKAFPTHWSGTWQGIISSDPEISTVGATLYPACAFTYDVAWHHYGDTELYGHTALGEEMGNVARDFFEYATGQGATDLANAGFYAGAPTAMAGAIKEAVRAIGEQCTYEKATKKYTCTKS